MHQFQQAVQQKEWSIAEALLQNLIQSAPAHPWTHFAKGYFAESQGDLTQAILDYKACLKIAPQFWEACFHLAYCYWETQQAVASVQILERALELQPQHFRIWQSLLPRLFEMGEHQMLQQTLDALLGPIGQQLKQQFTPQHVAEFENWQPILRAWRSHLDFCDPGLSSLDFYHSFLRQAQQQFPAVSKRLWSHAHLLPGSDRVLKVAWFSNEWSFPAIEHGYLPLMQHASPHFEHSAWIDNQEADGIDLVSLGFAKQMQIFNNDDQALAQALQLEQIDILFDLSNWFNPRRLALWAQKPVPVICSGGTNPPFLTGLPGIDLVFTDHELLPAPLNASAALVFLPSFFRWHAPETPAPKSRISGEQTLALGSAASLNKVNDLTLRLWVDLMNSLPEASFHLKNKWFIDPVMQQRWRVKWQMAGGDPSQLRFIDNQQDIDLFSFFASLDLVLDAFPYAGALSSCDALWVGTPVLSLAGGRHIADSICASVGIPELLAQNREQFLELGKSLARDPKRLADYRRLLPEKLIKSEICNYKHAMEMMETAWRSAWQNESLSSS